MRHGEKARVERAQRRGQWMEGKQEGRLGSVPVGLRSHDERFGVYSYCSGKPWEGFLRERCLV